MPRLQINQFGHFRVPKLQNPELYNDFFGTVEAVNNELIMIRDNDGYLYLTTEKDIIFEPCEKKEIV